MRSATFKLESLGFEKFDGFTKNEEWNGWDCPYFTYEQAQKVLQNHNELGLIIGQSSLAYYDNEINAFVFLSEYLEPEVFVAVSVNGQNYYPIGAFSWIWEETSNEQHSQTL